MSIGFKHLLQSKVLQNDFFGNGSFVNLPVFVSWPPGNQRSLMEILTRKRQNVIVKKNVD